jgi:hypothetical protein
MTSLPDIGNILIAIFYWFQSFIFNGELSVDDDDDPEEQEENS